MCTVLTRYFITNKRYLLVLAMILFAGISNASHIMGGEINYQWQTGNTYTIRLTMYRDCMGIPFSNYQTMNYESISCGLSDTFSVYQVGVPVSVSPICNSSLPNSSCNGGGLFGVQQFTYEGTITLPGNCSDWILSMTQCCRNGTITNLATPGAVGSYFSARLNNLDVPFNNSVTFGSIPYNMINNNITTQLSWNAYDVDGDVLSYELVAARDYNGSAPVSLLYQPGYSFLQPFQSSQPTTLNPTNGILDVTPNMVQVSVVCMKISEYRNAILVGEVYRDYQIAVTNGTNNAPVLTGINGTSNYVISGCPGDSISFNVTGSDPDIPQVVTLSMSNPGTSASFSSVPAPVISQGTFNWIPVTGDISASPYIFIITVDDDYCDYYGTYSQAYYVYVNGCNTNNVWPGDANSDGDANLYDLLAVGLAFNESGPVRPGATTSWTSQACPNWSTYFGSGINHKHADTDGDGNVTLNDTLAIYLNYGMNHPLRLSNPDVTTFADLVITCSDDTVNLSTTVNFDITLSTPVDSLYGLAFRMYFDPALIDPDSIMVSYPGCVFGTNGVDMIKVDRSQGLNGFVDIALSKINQVNITGGTGPVARVTIVTTDNVSGKVTLTVVPTDIVGVTVHEFPVQLNGIGDDVVIDPNFVGISEINSGDQLVVYPVPAGDFINISYSGSGNIQSYLLYDVTGKEVMNIQDPSNNSIIDIKELHAGSYLLKASAGKEIVYKKIVVF